MLLENKVGIVSGIGGGIGRSIALTFAREGADLALAARSETTLHDVAAEVESLGRRAICVPTDITDPEQGRRLAKEAYTAFGRIDVLVNNAFYSQPVRTLADSNLDDWRQAMEVNFWGSLNLTQAVTPYMRERGEGRVIMTSTAVRHGGEGYGAYIGSKAALRAVCRVLAKELGPWGIRVNTVAAGNTDGPNLQRHFTQQAEKRGVDPQVLREENASSNALRYIPTSDEVANAVLFFASDLARAATGQFMLVNGGQVFE